MCEYIYACTEGLVSFWHIIWSRVRTSHIAHVWEKLFKRGVLDNITDDHDNDDDGGLKYAHIWMNVRNVIEKHENEYYERNVPAPFFLLRIWGQKLPFKRKMRKVKGIATYEKEIFNGMTACSNFVQPWHKTFFSSKCVWVLWQEIIKRKKVPSSFRCWKVNWIKRKNLFPFSHNIFHLLLISYLFSLDNIRSWNGIKCCHFRIAQQQNAIMHTHIFFKKKFHHPSRHKKEKDYMKYKRQVLLLPSI